MEILLLHHDVKLRNLSAIRECFPTRRHIGNLSSLYLEKVDRPLGDSRDVG